MDRVTAVRSVHHDVIDEHAAATNRMHTGRPVNGSVAYPSPGSTIAHERRALIDGVPPYVLIGYPNVTRGPGFLGARDSYLYLTDTSQGPAGLTRPDGIAPERQARREALLGGLNVDGFFLEYDDDRSGDFRPLRFLPKGKTVVLGLVTTKFGQLESKDALKRRINEAAKYAPMEQLALS